jgi:hypothetical protein
MRIRSLFAWIALTALPGILVADERDTASTARFAVSPEAGKWMICAASYTGPDAAELAEQHAQEIRRRDKLPAYTFSWSNAERKRLKEELDRLQEMNPNRPVRRRTIRVEEQWAVLIGGWPDMDAARAALDKVKKLPAHDLKLNSGRNPFDLIVVQDPDGDKSKSQAVRRNPLHTAFVVRNPTVPADPKPTNKFDPFWKELNKEESFSLLKNPKAYTLVVKEYRGVSSLQPRTATSSFLEKLSLSNKGREVLDAGASNAHNLAETLRKLKFDAYVLHTRMSSIVTVGAFDSLDDPNLLRVQEQLAALRQQLANQQGGDPLQLMVQAIPMEVPRP